MRTGKRQPTRATSFTRTGCKLQRASVCAATVAARKKYRATARAGADNDTTAIKRFTTNDVDVATLVIAERPTRQADVASAAFGSASANAHPAAATSGRSTTGNSN